jgi:hypothetical protein
MNKDDGDQEHDQTGKRMMASQSHHSLCVQALRPDRLQSAIQQFAAEVLRLTSLSPPTASFAEVSCDMFKDLDKEYRPSNAALNRP